VVGAPGCLEVGRLAAGRVLFRPAGGAAGANAVCGGKARGGGEERGPDSPSVHGDKISRGSVTGVGFRPALRYKSL
jgi:hypothetical protein